MTEYWGEQPEDGYNPEETMLVHAFHIGHLNGRYDGTVDLLEFPDEVHQRAGLSLSLLDHEHRRTAGPAGIIVRAPIENVVNTYYTDAGSNTKDYDSLRRKAAIGNVISPRDLLAQTGKDSWNEVTVFGTAPDQNGQPNGSRLELTGFFIGVDPDGEYDLALGDRVKALAEHKKLPLIEIKRDFEIANDVRTDPDSSRIEVTFRGQDFTLRSPKPVRHPDSVAVFPNTTADWLFRVRKNFSGYQNVGFPSPEQMQEVLDFYANHPRGSAGLAKAFLEDYEKLDTERQRPNIMKDKSGKATAIKFTTGYGDNENTYFLGEDPFVTVENFTKMVRYQDVINIDPERNYSSEDSFEALIHYPDGVEKLDEVLAAMPAGDEREETKQALIQIHERSHKSWPLELPMLTATEARERQEARQARKSMPFGQRVRAWSPWGRQDRGSGPSRPAQPSRRH